MDALNFSRFRLGLLLLVGLVLGLYFAAAAWNVWTDYELTMAAAERSAQSITSAIDEHAARTFGEADRAILSVIETIRTNGGIAAFGVQDLHNLLKSKVQLSPQIRSLYVINRHGAMAAHSIEYPAPTVFATDRDYFLFHQQNRSSDLFISRPFQNRSNHKWRIGLSRRLEGVNGEFEGIVALGLDPEYFENFYRSLDVGSNGRVTLLRRDGATLIFYPFMEKAMTFNYADKLLFKKHLPQAAAGIYHNPKAGIDDSSRLIAYRTVSSYPLVAVVSIYELVRRGHRVMTLTSAEVISRNGHLVGEVREIKGATPDLAETGSVVSFWGEATLSPLCLETPLGDLDLIFWRQNPPLDISCAARLAEATADTVAAPLMVNRPGAMIEAGGKSYILNFPDVIPSTWLVDNRAEFLDLAGRYPHGVVVKPLSGYGGQGVIRCPPGRVGDGEPAVRFFFPMTAGDIEPPVMVQEYLPQVMQGDVRVLMLNGEPVGAMRRLPARGDFRTNVSLGGRVLPHHLTSHEEDVCSRIGPRLVSDGLVFVGLDLIDGRLIEVNYVSPGGIPRINRLSSLNIETSVVDYLEK
ncbi:MAG: hypothetical protein HQK58_05925 [Deltaproteobacteria bacterium]|nr:hypothetical protein [Deltaproteobacteria bacterium]